MVDVVFLLIVFFLTTLSLEALTKLELDLPKQKGEESVEDAPAGLIINITADGMLVIEREEVSVEEALAMVSVEAFERGTSRAVDVLVRADRSAPLSAVNGVARGLVKLDVPEWRLATDPSGRGGGP